MPNDTPITQAHLSSAVKEIIGHFNESQGEQNERLESIETKVDAIMNMLALRKDVERLERSLLRKGVLTQQDLAAAE